MISSHLLTCYLVALIISIDVGARCGRAASFVNIICRYFVDWKWYQNGRKWSPRPSKPPKRPSRPPKMAPRRPKRLPKTGQEPPQTTQMTPRGTQEAPQPPGALQNRSKNRSENRLEIRSDPGRAKVAPELRL